MAVVLSGLISINMAQLVSTPTAGHWVNGGEAAFARLPPPKSAIAVKNMIFKFCIRFNARRVP